jgi:hypothetical protein
MRGLLIGALVICAAAAATGASAPAGAEPPDPCALVTPADAAPVFGKPPPRARASGGSTRSCTYAVRRQTMTVQTRALASQAAFMTSMKRLGGLVFPIEGLSNAFSAGSGREMLLWKNGVEVIVAFTGVDPVFATQESLANAVLHGL